jgi:hypothetical protein
MVWAEMTHAKSRVARQKLSMIATVTNQGAFNSDIGTKVPVRTHAQTRKITRASQKLLPGPCVKYAA